jgi:hypothetical protein
VEFARIPDAEGILANSTTGKSDTYFSNDANPLSPVLRPASRLAVLIKVSIGTNGLADADSPFAVTAQREH